MHEDYLNRPEPTEDRLMHLSLTMLAFALLTTAFLWPVEDAVNGSGLHLVIMWSILGMLHGLRCWRASKHDKDPESLLAPFGLLDVGVLLIAIGHVVGTIVVFREGGDRRSALNLTFEWLGLLIALRLFRSLSMARRQTEQTFQVIVAIAVGLAAYGIWQHHVFYPEQSAWYLAQRTELDHEMARSGGAGLMRATEIISELQKEGIPLDGANRILWENRLLSSSEPFATFSLANTLAGVLATALVLMVGQLSFGRMSNPRMTMFSVAISMLQIVLVAYCLILTKSRSAWAGAAAGIIILTIVRSRTSAGLKLLRWGVFGAAGVSGIVGLAVFSGALDKEVILESPRSLQFRLLYWSGTLKMLEQHPLTGAGPGNFRQLYLQHKADESSEEIRDPHNFVLESWSAGGIIGLVGLTILILSTLRSLIATDSDLADSTPDEPIRKKPNRIIIRGLLLGFAIHFGWEWINGQPFTEDFVNRLLLLAGVVLLMAQSSGQCMRLDRTSGLAATVAMMVNLLAAGGFEMPAVMLLLLVCATLGTSKTEPVSGTATAKLSRKLIPLSHSFLCLGVAIVVLKFGLVPVSSMERQLLLAEDMLNRQRNPRAALESYSKAAESDPLAVIPRQRIAELETYRLKELESLQSLQRESDESGSPDEAEVASKINQLIPNAIEACNMLISADRRSSYAFRTKADCLATAARLQQDSGMRKEAIIEQQRVVQMYPSSLEHWIELIDLYLADADTIGQWGQQIQSASDRALELNEINHQWGHQDQYLSEQQMQLLNQAREMSNP